jgi:PEP-CTERM motif-containing protein
MHPCFRSLSGAALAALLACGGPAYATDVPLGSITAPISLAIGNSGLEGAFTDTYTFSIAASDSFSFDSFVSTGFSNRFFILDLAGALYAGATLLESGVGTTTYLPEGFPSRQVDFAALTLGPGDYTLAFTGTATSAFPGITSSYAGSVSFGPVAAIPEPSSWMLMLAAVPLLGVAVRRHRRSNE